MLEQGGTAHPSFSYFGSYFAHGPISLASLWCFSHMLLLNHTCSSLYLFMFCLSHTNLIGCMLVYVYPLTSAVCVCMCVCEAGKRLKKAESGVTVCNLKNFIGINITFLPYCSVKYMLPINVSLPGTAPPLYD